MLGGLLPSVVWLTATASTDQTRRAELRGLVCLGLPSVATTAANQLYLQRATFDVVFERQSLLVFSLVAVSFIRHLLGTKKAADAASFLDHPQKGIDVKKLLLTTLLLTASTTAASAAVCNPEDKTFFDQPSLMIGVVFNFGGGASAGQGLGITAKILSNDWQNYQAAALGVTFFPMKETKKVALDASLAYKWDGAAASIGWDLTNSKPQFGLGYVDTQEPGCGYRVPV